MGKALSVSRLLLGHDQEQRRQQRALLPVVVPPYSVSGEILLRLAACSTWTSCSPTPGKSVAATFLLRLLAAQAALIAEFSFWANKRELKSYFESSS